MKVSELSGAELDYWVAKAQGWVKSNHLKNMWVTILEDGCEFMHDFIKDYAPSREWKQCGPLIEKYNVEISPAFNGHGGWYAEIKYEHEEVDAFYGNSAQQAICRAVVASIYGEEIPDET